MILKVTLNLYKESSLNILNFCDIDINNFLEWKIRKFAYLFVQYLDILPDCAKRGLSRTISTVFNANILFLLTIGTSHVQKKVDIDKHKKMQSFRFEFTILKFKLRMLSIIMLIGQRFPTLPYFDRRCCL